MGLRNIFVIYCRAGSIWIFSTGIRHLPVAVFFCIIGIHGIFGRYYVTVITKNIKDRYLTKYQLLSINTVQK